MSANDKLVIGLAGPMLSGKTAAANFFVQHFNAKQLKMSALLNQVLNILDQEITRDNQVKLITMLRQRFGDGVLASALIHSIKNNSHPVYLMDGMRKLDELVVCKREIKNFKLVYITSSIEKRFERLKGRDEKAGEQYQTWEEFEKSHHYETEMDIPRFEAYADFVVENNGTEQELYDKLTSVFTKIIC